MSEYTHSPVIDQYIALRSALPERALLLFKLGDYWEAFGDDAKELQRLVGGTLTKRKGVAMAGIPAHEKSKTEKILKTHGKIVAYAEVSK